MAPHNVGFLAIYVCLIYFSKRVARLHQGDTMPPVVPPPERVQELLSHDSTEKYRCSARVARLHPLDKVPPLVPPFGECFWKRRRYRCSDYGGKSVRFQVDECLLLHPFVQECIPLV